MNTLIILAALIAVALAAPQGHVSLSQDTLGNYNLNYDADGISRSERRSQQGDVSGTFSYLDPHGIPRSISYIAGGQLGFQAFGADVPQPVQDTPEVAHARANHLAILRAAELAQPFQLL